MKLGHTQAPELRAWSCSGVGVGGFDCNHSIPVQSKLTHTQAPELQLLFWSCSGMGVGGFDRNHSIPVQSKLRHRPQNCGLGPVLGVDVGGFNHDHSVPVQSKLRHRPQNCGLDHVLAWMLAVLNMIIQYLCSQNLDTGPIAVGFFSGRGCFYVLL